MLIGLSLLKFETSVSAAMLNLQLFKPDNICSYFKTMIMVIMRTFNVTFANETIILVTEYNDRKIVG
jgi:hypothetical protein